jgi:imidazolonepropionase
VTRQLIRGIARLLASPEEVVERAAVLVEDGRVSWVGEESNIPPSSGVVDEADLGGVLVTPGLVDAHTHPVYAGSRFEEIAMRSAGASYGEIAARGGGISSTVAATRNATIETLAAGLDMLLAEWLAGGVTTLEAKTGYHLDADGELADVRLLAGRNADETDSQGSEPSPPHPPPRGGRPSLEITFLAAHALPPEWAGDPDGYVREVAGWCWRAREEGARHVDAFCDEGYFTPAQSRVVLEAGREAGLIPRLHADELARTGGAELAAALQCASADHLLRLDESGTRALASAGVVATLAPVTALAMGRTPPARALIDAGVTIALGSDHNPGTCGTTSMSLVIALAVAELSLSVREAVAAATVGGARSLRLSDRGTVAPGKRADLVAWPAEHEGAFAWSYGMRPEAVWKEGRRVA